MIVGVFILLVGLMDLVDGTIAKKQKANKKYGFFFSETANALSDAIILMAIVVYYFVTISYLEMLMVLFLLLINFILRELMLLAQLLKVKNLAITAGWPHSISAIHFNLRIC